MRTTAKLSLTVLLAALLLSVAVTSASARNFSASNQNIRVAWSRLEFEGAVTVRCQVTLEGSFHSRTIAKITNSLVGVITRANAKSESCTNANVGDEGLPWHILYEGFRGALPRIESVTLLLRAFLVQLRNVLGTGVECRYGTATDNITGQANINATNETTNFIPISGRNTMTLLEARDNAFLRCPAIGRMAGSGEDGAVTLLGNTNRIRLTLI